jgi:AMP deaminase
VFASANSIFNPDNWIDVFRPLFEVTKDPSSHPKLHVFLQRVIGFDTVDDESKTERRYHRKFPYPKQWDYPQSPPYSYWSVINIGHVMPLTLSFRVYYMFANMASLNKWRRARGFSD